MGKGDGGGGGGGNAKAVGFGMSGVVPLDLAGQTSVREMSKRGVSTALALGLAAIVLNAAYHVLGNIFPNFFGENPKARTGGFTPNNNSPAVGGNPPDGMPSDHESRSAGERLGLYSKFNWWPGGVTKESLIEQARADKEKAKQQEE